MSNSTKVKKKFTTDYTYELRQSFKIYYGAYSPDRADINQGLIGDIGPFFYSNNYFKNIDRYWQGCYFHKNLLKTDWVKLEFVFNEYANVASIKEELGGKDGKIKGDEVKYSGKSGLELGSQSYIEIPQNITTSVKKFKNICYYYAFHYEEPLGNDFSLLRRGPADKPHSIEILMNKRNGFRTVSIKVGFVTTSGSPKTITFQDERKIMNSTFNELQVCLSFAIDNIASSFVYLNGEVKFLEVVTGFLINLDKYAQKHEIFDKEAIYQGKATIEMFSILEGGGGAIFSQEDTKQVIFFLSFQVKKKCLEECKLPLNNIVMSFKCLSCQKKSNNANSIPEKKCKKFCKEKFFN